MSYNVRMSPVASPTQRSSEHHGLVIIEGITGSLKSTTMRFVAKALEEAGRPALGVHERADPHPVRATDELQYWFEPWRESTAEQLASRAISRWRSFAEAVRPGTSVPVLDGQLFHGDLTNLFLMEASFDELAAYCESLAQLIRPLHPLVVCLRQENVERAVRTISAERGGSLGALPGRLEVEGAVRDAPEFGRCRGAHHAVPRLSTHHGRAVRPADAGKDGHRELGARLGEVQPASLRTARLGRCTKRQLKCMFKGRIRPTEDFRRGPLILLCRGFSH
jgi:hypothetical protein